MTEATKEARDLLLERRCLQELDAKSDEIRRATVNALSQEEMAWIHEVARGQVAELAPGARANAVTILGFASPNSEETMEILATLAVGSDQSLAVRAVRAGAQQANEKFRALLGELVEGGDLTVAVAAARSLVRGPDPELAAHLQRIRERVDAASQGTATATLASLSALIERSGGK